MKKIMFTLLVLAASMNVLATTTLTASAVITMSSTTSSADLTLAQVAELNDGVNAGYCAEIYGLASHVEAIYAIYGGKNYESFGTKTYSEMPVGIKTCDDVNYTLTFSNVTGTITLFDAVENQLITLTNAGTYNFTAAANSTIADRFIINHTVVLTPEICHHNGALQIQGWAGTVKVLNMDGTATSIADFTADASAQEISLTGLAAGQYKVEWNAQTLVIRVL